MDKCISLLRQTLHEFTYEAQQFNLIDNSNHLSSGSIVNYCSVVITFQRVPDSSHSYKGIV